MYIIINDEKEYFTSILYRGVKLSKYEISNYGRVRRKINNTILKCQTDKDGYQKLVLTDDDKNRLFVSVHRLVAYTFIGEDNGNPIIMHLDDDPSNNYYKNLKWGTQKENITHAINHGKFNKDRIKTLVKRFYDEALIKQIKELIALNYTTTQILNLLNIEVGTKERRNVTSLIHDIKKSKSHI